MNCTEFLHHLNDYLEKETNEITTKACELHLEDCVSCMKTMLKTQDLAKELRKLDQTPEAQLTKAQEQAIWQGTWKQSLSYNTSTLVKHGLIAATLLLCLSFLPYSLYQKMTEPQISFATLEQKEVYLMFTSEEAQDQAVFTIHIPDNYEYPGQGHKRLITWTAPLEKGKNLLTIPLVASKGGNGMLKTQVKIKGQVQTFYIQLNSPT